MTAQRSAIHTSASGLVAGDSGAAIWAQRIGLGRAKEYLLTGEPLTAKHAAEIGLINQCVIPSQLDDAVTAFCNLLKHGSMQAIRWTKVLMNLELKRVAVAVMDAGIAYESVTARSADHREAVKAMQEKRRPVFCSDNTQALTARRVPQLARRGAEPAMAAARQHRCFRVAENLRHSHQGDIGLLQVA